MTRGGPKFPNNVYYGDIVRGLPIEPASCEAIYCSHALEHLSLEDCRVAIRNTYNALKPGGVFRCVLPDLEIMTRQYLASSEEQRAVQFIESSYLGHPRRPRGLRGLAQEWLGNSRHLWMWDYSSLAAELRAVGFQTIRRASFGDAETAQFADVERWKDSLGIECRKQPA